MANSVSGSCEKCSKRSERLGQHWSTAGYRCPLDCNDFQWDRSDHHSHNLCNTCGMEFERVFNKIQDRGRQRQFDKQLLRMKKDHALHKISVIMGEKYSGKLNIYLWHNAKRGNSTRAVEARKKYFDWKPVNDPHKYKFHCENELCFRPLKAIQVEQVLNRIYCRSCSRTVSLSLYQSYN
ncbi:uncharacterized protein OCT59_002900 [Rhizophagus irregularis]|uniref:Uncharacterized protein n=2 Tax=Rhizophagus irregularis TaxID=588596 RepID=A0A015N2P5_RHIIW|nr:hypothetical protein GLOIN_2v1780788 [Rhizophagus irregularis DAOM 181602=DAOM 197198]EXX73413.1 hypothetical protein RirG_060540 [Rhizophagus irregularis DAOM 197198w]UZO11329.1 hypothetical protein OCT59_002900 [Rhizophagus irregularis]EXX74434.1 hypothetical protein RirG_051140 [Rhizophagus irregularis DAOM 197198w]EXX79380.1 hypothetical protein RirG_006170 [Rhizophagus irregularis DAOM 197198w]POG66212.1 hypothetical protein GLOIN_2v1780788 [Rhizophagus irregularis DAOM 181602=DAOM 197|eukprot:XP_025173078.1 hypothetical protein GLOIN_2v1780788 [Rhizophagus irregularis DAOM 181602=DAOM 197198]